MDTVTVCSKFVKLSLLQKQLTVKHSKWLTLLSSGSIGLFVLNKMARGKEWKSENIFTRLDKQLQRSSICGRAGSAKISLATSSSGSSFTTFGEASLGCSGWIIGYKQNGRGGKK